MQIQTSRTKRSRPWLAIGLAAAAILSASPQASSQEAAPNDPVGWARRLEPGWHLADGNAVETIFARPNFEATPSGTRIGWIRTEFRLREPGGPLSSATRLEVDCQGFRSRELEVITYQGRGLGGVEMGRSIGAGAWRRPPVHGEFLIPYACAKTVAARLDPGTGYVIPVPGFRPAHSREDLEPEHLCPERWRKERVEISGVLGVATRFGDINNTPYAVLTLLPTKPVCEQEFGQVTRSPIEVSSHDAIMIHDLATRAGQRVTLQGHLVQGIITSDQGPTFALWLVDTTVP